MVKRLVDFTPDPEMTNKFIVNLNDDVPNMTPQQFAMIIASSVAALAFVMHSTNTTNKVKELFGQIVDDAGKQYDARGKELAKKKIIQ